jgi:hypothetical protein
VLVSTDEESPKCSTFIKTYNSLTLARNHYLIHSCRQIGLRVDPEAGKKGGIHRFCQAFIALLSAVTILFALVVCGEDMGLRLGFYIICFLDSVCS